MLYHSDEPAKKDFLQRKDYAKAFAKLSQLCKTPLVIGLYGGWGIGKTTLMKMIHEEIKDSSESRSLVIWFNAWQHQFDDNPALSLLHSIVSFIEKGNSEESKIKKLKDSLKKISLAVASGYLKTVADISVKDITSIFNEIEDRAYEVRDAKTKLRDSFKYFIDEASKSDKSGAENRRIIFFIDDLDRCTPERTLILLENLKIFLNLEHCVYFLGVDRDILVKNISRQYSLDNINSDNETKYVDFYLDKIIQLPFHIPPVSEESVNKYISKHLLKGANSFCRDDVKTYCIELLVTGLGDNPRSIKRFVNTLLLNDQLLRSNTNKDQRDPMLLWEGTEYDIRVLTLVLLIQHLSYNELYRLIREDPRQLKLLKEPSYSKLYGTETPLHKILSKSNLVLPKKDDNVNPYIYSTSYLTDNIGDSEATKLYFVTKRIQLHQEWLEGQDKGKDSGERADFSRISDLDETNFSGAKLVKSIFHNSDFSKSNFNNTDLFQAEVYGSIFSGCSLNKTVFSESKAYGSIFKGVDATDAFFNKADLYSADFSNATLIGAEFNEAAAGNSIFNNADIKSASFKGVRAEGANFSNITATDTFFNEALLPKTDFSNAVLRKTIFTKAQAYASNFSRVDATDASFDETDLYAADFSNSTLASANFTKANLGSVNFDGANVKGADFSDARGITGGTIYKATNFHLAEFNQNFWIDVIYNQLKDKNDQKIEDGQYDNVMKRLNDMQNNELSALSLSDAHIEHIRAVVSKL